jgi:hypothetical protein
VFHIEANHVKSGFFFASKRNKIFASISNFASEAKVRVHPSLHKKLIGTILSFLLQTASANVISLCDYNNCNAAGHLQISLMSVAAATLIAVAAML